MPSPSLVRAAQSRFGLDRIAVAVAFFVNGFGIGSWTVQVPVVGAKLGLAPAHYGFMVLIFGLGAVIAMPAVGALIARYGSRSVTIGTQALFALAFACLIAAPSIITTGMVLFALGIGIGGMDVAMNANAVSVERSLDRAIMSSCHGFWSLGAFAGAGLGGTLIVTFGPLGHTMIVAGFALTALLYEVPNLLRDARQPQDEGAGERRSFAEILRERRTPLLLSIAIGLIALAGFVQEGVVIDWSAVYLRDELGVSIAASGFGFAAFSFTMALFRFFGDGIRERFGAVRTVRISLIFALTGLGLLILADGLIGAIAGFLVLGIGLSNVVPIAFSAAGNVRGLADGTGISIASAIAYSGGLVAPAAVGIVADAYGFVTVFSALLACSLAVVIAAGLLHGADRDGPAVS